MRPYEFFQQNPVFRFEAFAAFHAAAGRARTSTWSLLRKHVAAGNLINVRRGIYAVVPAGMTPQTAPVDPYLLCSRLSDDAVIDYAQKLGSAVAAARVGLFIEQHQDALMPQTRHLEALQRLRPRQERYFDRSLNRRGKLVRRWNLIVPEQILERSWEEIA